MSPAATADLSMQELFRIEAEGNGETLVRGLLALERDPASGTELADCMRAAHSLKGAARLVEVEAAVVLAHAMEDAFVAAQSGIVTLRQDDIDLLLRGVDLMSSIARLDPISGAAAAGMRAEVDRFVAELARRIAGQSADPVPSAPVLEAGDSAQAASVAADASSPAPPEAVHVVAATAPLSPEPAPVLPVVPTLPPMPEGAPPAAAGDERALRIGVDAINSLLGLAGESLVESRWLKPFGDELLRLKRLHQRTATALDGLRAALPDAAEDERVSLLLGEAREGAREAEVFLADRLAELDAAERQSSRLAHRLYDQALACRMRPLADGAVGFPRLVRDLSRSLGKRARFALAGASTLVDRDILERLDAPLMHILRNAVDHGIEPPATRTAAGKPAEGVVVIDARQRAGTALITVSDDGAGVDLEALRAAVVARRLVAAENAARLSEAELLEFLFLPGFTMKPEVTEVSGRGVGLDVVQDMLRKVRGSVRVTSRAGQGTTFHLSVPLTLSVLRTLVVDIAGEPYAFPLGGLLRALSVPKDGLRSIEGRQFFDLEGEAVGLVSARQILAGGEAGLSDGDLAVVVIGGEAGRYGVVVDRFIGARELVLHELDPRLGAVKDISAAAILDDSSPVLVIDVDDLVRSIEKLAAAARLAQVGGAAETTAARARKRILVVDDSLTVRELERKLLEQRGYAVETAVDGLDGWNAVRASRFDLVVTDIDMPRMDGIALVGMIRQHPGLKGLPVTIVSYKDRDEDRRRGLEAGADYYLTKGGFQDDSFIEAVVDLIGEAAA